MSNCNSNAINNEISCKIKKGATGVTIIVELSNCSDGTPFDLTAATTTDGIIQHEESKTSFRVPGAVHGDPANGEVLLTFDQSHLDLVGWHVGEIDLITPTYTGRSGNYYFEVADTISIT